MNFSKRLNWTLQPNAISVAAAEARREGRELLDLTETNPTRVDLPYPDAEIADAMARATRAPYRPDPLGLRSAREAVAERFAVSSPDRIVLTASTSEAYSFLLRLLLDPGDELLTITPGYPLFEHLADLDGVRRTNVSLDWHRRWTLEPGAMTTAVSDRTRAVAVVSPNNPTGSYLTVGEQDAVAASCAGADVALISDEVFADFPIEPPADRAPTAAARTDVLSFSLGGLSKYAGLPNLKLSWIIIGGPAGDVARAVEALELISDTFLSVSTPVQEALPDLLRLSRSLRQAILSRVRSNAQTLRHLAEQSESVQALPVEGGWSAVLRVPSIGTDEALVLHLLRDQGVLVHPGYYFDFARDGYLVLSLLPGEDLFREGARRLVSCLGGRAG